MAVTEQSYTGNGSTTNYSFTFPYLKSTDIEVQVDATVTTAWSLANATTVQFNTAPSNGAKIKILRQTNVDNLTATFYAGSAIKSEDLNDNYTQNLYKTQEIGNRFFSNTGGTMTGDLTMGEDANIIFEGATDNAHETTVTVTDPTADRTITIPNVTGTVVTTGDSGTVTSTMIADATIATADIANSAITTAKIANDAVDGDKLATNSVGEGELSTNAVTTAKIADSNVTTAKIAGDAVTGAKIADDSINSEHYVDGSIDTAHIADDQVTTAKIADDAVTTAKIPDSAITSAKIADGTIVTADLANGLINNAKLADASISTTKYQDDTITTAKISDSQITTAKIANDAVDGDKIATNAVGEGELSTNAVTTAKIADAQITTAKIANDAVDGNKIATDSVGEGELSTGAVTTVKIAADAVTDAKIADNAVTTDHIADAELTTLAGMQSGTASILAGGTALTATLAEINTVVDGKGVQTTISDSDAHYPTSGAVVDYVAAQIAPIGGLEVIADEDNFPTTQPASGVVISISDAAGIVVNGSGTSTTARTAGNGSDNVTINNFPSSLYSETLASGNGLMVTSTGSSHTYNYHKLLASESDVKQLSDDINDFNSRYRINAGEPGSNNDDGDLVWDTSADKMKVYDATASAWKEVTSSGDFKFLVPVDAGTTTAATWDGSDTSFDLKEATNSGSAASVTNINQLMVVLNGVVQKPNAGSWSGSGEGFYLTDSDTIRFATAPPTGSTCFIVQSGSALTITTPGDNTVATAKIQNSAVTTAKIATDAITGAKLADDAVDSEHITNNSIDTAHIADNQVTTAKIANGTITNDNVDASAAIALSKLASTPAVLSGSTDNTVCTVTGANAITGESNVHINGGHLIVGHTTSTTTSNGESPFVQIKSTDSRAGTSFIRHSADAAGGGLYIGKSRNATIGSNTIVQDDDELGRITFSGDDGTDINTVGAEIQAHVDGTPGSNDMPGRLTFRTTADGAAATSERMRITSDGKVNIPDNGKFTAGASDDLQIYHDGTNSYIDNDQGSLIIKQDAGAFIYLQATHVFLESEDGEKTADFISDGAVKLYYNNVKQLETTANGVQTYFTAPYALLGIDATQSVANTTSHTVDWVETTDRGGDFDTSNERFTAPVAGDYLVCLSIQFTENVNALHTGIYKNGTSPGASFDPWVNWGDDTRAGCTSAILTLEVNDYILLQTYQNTGSAKNLETNRTKATIRFLG